MSGRFDIESTPIEGLHALSRKPIGDARGFLMRLFCEAELEPLLGRRRVTQANYTLTEHRGTVRGLHFQRPPHAETKLVSCLRGEVFDVAVDLRQGSPTFLDWHAEVLSPRNQRALLIPEGFAHGFQTLTADCEMLYFHTASYHPSSEGGLNVEDPALGIAWPLPIAERSERDAGHPMVDASFEGITL